MKRLSKRAVRPEVRALEGRCLLSGLSGAWLGQDGRDLVGPSSRPGSDGVQDVHISLGGLATGRAVASATVRGIGGGEWRFNAGGAWAAAFVRSSSTSGELYIEPYQAETGRAFTVEVVYDNGATDACSLSGGLADPNKRMPQAAVQATWAGQDGSDRTGLTASVGPDGLQDVHVVLANLSPGIPIDSVLIDGVPGRAYRAGLNRETVTNAELVRATSNPSQADLYFSPDRNLSGLTLTIQIVYATNRTDTTSVTARATDAGMRMPTPPAPPVRVAGVTASWVGQDGLDLTGPGDVHLAVAKLPAGRSIVAALLTDLAGGSWVYRRDPNIALTVDPFALPLGVRTSATTADLSFPPIRDESGGTLSLRLNLDDGSMALVNIAGGSVDLARRAAAPASTSVTARPGDDLNDLASRFGTVTLTAGTYVLNRPLVLDRPVRITADPGATLVFNQDKGDAAWTAAIKVKAGGTTLDGFAVRFAGPIRWNNEVSYGPAVIGTADEFDQNVQGPLVALTFTRLDLQAPTASIASGWEKAPGLIRLASAQSGRIENCVLKGGIIEFQQGPWRIAGNTYLGTMPNTYADAAFAGHDTHDLVLSGNTLRPTGSSGKTWRFLVLTSSGWGDLIENNTVDGIGPRDGDTIPDANAAEVVLTEAYRIKFEGSPLSVSTDGLIVQAPPPQGDPVLSGDVLAILSGPSAGQWRRIVQVLDPRTFVLDKPLSSATGAVSISRGFVNQSYRGNTIDCGGSSVACVLNLVGNHFGTTVANNRLLGGGTPFKILASTTEAPVAWGWTHSPSLGLVFEGNTTAGAVHPGTLGVERGAYIKSNKGRVYFSGSFSANNLGASLGDPASPAAVVINDPTSVDPGEALIGLTNNVTDAQAATILVHLATVNGLVLVDQSLALPSSTPVSLPAPIGLRLVNETSGNPGSGITNDARLRFDAVPGAVGYEYRLGATGTYQAISGGTTFLPTGLTQGTVTVFVRALDSGGNRGADASFSFVYDSVAPGTAPPRLQATSDTGISTTDGITASRQPVFDVTGDINDQVVLLRNGTIVAWRYGPGSLRDPGVSKDGVYKYQLARVDLARNGSASSSLTVTIDTTPPPPPTGLILQSNWLVSFQPTQVGDYHEYRAGSSVPFVSLGKATTFLPTAGLVPGRNLVFIRAVDAAGNVGNAATLVLDTAQPPVSGAWLGQDGRDYVGPGTSVAADGLQDIHIVLANLRPERTIKTLTVSGIGGGQWAFNIANGAWRAAVARTAGSRTADVYIQPYQRETGRSFRVELVYDDGTGSAFWVTGGAADPSLRTVAIPSVRARRSP